jgi:hypothetical protein
VNQTELWQRYPRALGCFYLACAVWATKYNIVDVLASAARGDVPRSSLLLWMVTPMLLVFGALGVCAPRPLLFKLLAWNKRLFVHSAKAGKLRVLPSALLYVGPGIALSACMMLALRGAR